MIYCFQDVLARHIGRRFNDRIRVHCKIVQRKFEELDRSNRAFEIIERTTNVLNEEVPSRLDAEKQKQWERKHDNRVEALRSMMYFMGITGFSLWDEEEESTHNELFKLLKKHDLLWMKK
ncbi:hypothetical protein I6N90_18885 [Paenibacillus sp. GSMTC-2017]|uniref:hypothetical protein n=1 Tax=Paenibacillus sp. GSMTC-2017 TaxID=2794350 RepID=UPI0018DA1489|nr:hypothetical protein [Paenibacillus sp. GSMTC-2017]MBH5319868.1 hypothetical protein [Paenibacillus sp. GSMTC-2017]